MCIVAARQTSTVNARTRQKDNLPFFSLWQPSKQRKASEFEFIHARVREQRIFFFTSIVKKFSIHVPLICYFTRIFAFGIIPTPSSARGSNEAPAARARVWQTTPLLRDALWSFFQTQVARVWVNEWVRNMSRGVVCRIFFSAFFYLCFRGLFWRDDTTTARGMFNLRENLTVGCDICRKR